MTNIFVFNPRENDWCKERKKLKRWKNIELAPSFSTVH